MSRAALTFLVALVTSPVVSPALAAPSCAQPCKQETAECLRTRCAGLRGDARRACVETCRGLGGCTQIRTLAYVVTECRQDPSGMTARQALIVRRGNCDPVIVTSVDAPFLPGVDYCDDWGLARSGHRSILWGVFTRLGVSPDGSVVVFELTNNFSFSPAPFQQLSAEEGIYAVDADGRGLRPLGPPSRNASSRHPTPGGRMSTFDFNYYFSPDGRTIVFTDRGPGPAGEDAIQVVTLDVVTGRRAQVTRLPSVNEVALNQALAAIGRAAMPGTLAPRFVDGETLAFFTYANPDGRHPDGGYFTVKTDGTRLRAVTIPVAISGSHVVPIFGIGGGGTNILTIDLPGTPLDRPFLGFFTELFVLDGKNFLQLTNFHRADTGYYGKLLDRRARRAYFSASADPPLGTNPSENCQLFSVDTLGTGLRQLTHFRAADHSVDGCYYTSFPGCSVGPLFQDARTRTLVFHSSCDPFATGAYGGHVFAMRPDGTRLRQLTATRGRIEEPEGAVSVQLPGPFAYSALDGGR